MTDEQKEQIYKLLLVDIGRRNVLPDEREFIKTLIQSAAKRINEEGITLDFADVNDCLLCSQYAAWMYSKRRKDGQETAMPRMLRWELNQRVFKG
jgi:hypothetical protein